MTMKFITRGGESLEVTKEDRKATRSEGMGLEVSASHALVCQCGGEGNLDFFDCGWALFGNHDAKSQEQEYGVF